MDKDLVSLGTFLIDISGDLVFKTLLIDQQKNQFPFLAISDQPPPLEQLKANIPNTIVKNNNLFIFFSFLKV